MFGQQCPDYIQPSKKIQQLEAENARLREELDATESLRAEQQKFYVGAVTDAKRYRWLREILHGSVGGGVEVNDQALVYEKPEPGEEVRVYWYPNTPVGFCESHGETLDAVIDDAIAKEIGK